MGQINKEFAENIFRRAANNQHSPLTVWEQKQLAYAWLRLHAPQSQYVQFPPEEPRGDSQ